MYHAPPRKVILLKRLLVFIFSSIVVVGLTIVFVAMTKGVRYNEADGQFKQGGLLQIGSTPNGATVRVNDAPISSSTPVKLQYFPGNYELSIEEDGYLRWQKSVKVMEGGITWATYPRLIPKKLTPQTVAVDSSIISALPSPSGKRYATLTSQKNVKIALKVYDIKNDIPTSQTSALSEKLFTQNDVVDSKAKKPITQSSGVTLRTWSGNEAYALATNVSAASTEWIMLAIKKPTQSVNISKDFDINIQKAQFLDYDGRDIVAITDGDVRIIDTIDKTISRPLVRDVAEINVYDNNYIFYTKNIKDGVREYGYVTDEGITHSLAKQKASSAKDYKAVPISVGQYYRDFYLVISEGTSAYFYKVDKLPKNKEDSAKAKLIRTVTFTRPVEDVRVSSNSQIMIAQDSVSFASLNLETNTFTQMNTLVGADADSDDKQAKLKPLDNHLYWISVAGTLRTLEFDGTNQNDIMPLYGEFGATLSRNGKYIYGFVKGADGFELQRVQLLDIKTPARIDTVLRSN